jgi:hypothetical protein
MAQAQDHMKLGGGTSRQFIHFTYSPAKLRPKSSAHKVNLYKLEANFHVTPKKRAFSLVVKAFAMRSAETSPRPSSRLLRSVI